MTPKNVIAGTLLATAVGLGYILITDQNNALAVEFDGKIITTEYTDDNTGEDLIIRTDRETYGGFGQIPVYFSVENTSGQDETVDIRFLFEGSERSVTVYEIISREAYTVQEPVWEAYQKPDCLLDDGTTGPCEAYRQTGTTTVTKYRDRLEKITGLEKAREASQKEIPARFKAEPHAYPHAIPAGEIRFYKALVKVEPQTRSEWLIEAVGSNGGYGYLR